MLRSLHACWLFLLIVAANPLAAATITWTGSVDSDWATAGNWSPASPRATDDVVFNPTGKYPSDLRLQLNAELEIGTLSISGDFDPLADYTFEPLERATHQLSITGGMLDVDIPTTGTTNKNVELDSDVVFSSTLSILRSGDAANNARRRLIFNRGLIEKGSGLSVVINNASANNNEGIRFRGALDWTGTTTIEIGAIELNGARVDPTFGAAGSPVFTSTLGATTIRMNRSTAAGDATTENDFRLGGLGDTRFIASGGATTTETWTIQGSFSGGASGLDLAFDLGGSDNIRLDADIDIASRLVIQTPAGTTLGSVLLDGTLSEAAGGVTVQASATLGGTGAIGFAIDNGVATNFGGKPIEVIGTFDIRDLTLDIKQANSGADGVSEYVIVDYTNGQLVGTAFASVVGLPNGYYIDPSADNGTKVVLKVVPEPSLARFLMIAFALYVSRLRVDSRFHW